MFYLRNCFNICSKLHRLTIFETCSVHKIVKQRQFRTSAIVSGIVFKSNENMFAHGILQDNVKCSVLRGEQNIQTNQKCADIDFNQNWSNMTSDDILEHLSTIGDYCKRNEISISDERFDKFVDVCTERCFDFTDDQLIKTLQLLMHYPPTESPKSRNFVELWNALDDACVERIDGWSYDKILYVCDHWAMLNLGKFNKFNWRGSLKVGRKLRKLPPHQLVQIMFYLNIKRSAVVEMFEFETNLMKSMDELSLNELAIICIGFFKTQTKIKTPELVSNIFHRLIREIDTVQDIPLVCILKVIGAAVKGLQILKEKSLFYQFQTLRYSSNTSHAILIKQLLSAANGQISRLTALSCLHLALLGTHIHLCEQNCIEQIVRRFSEDVKSIRLKDFERITFVMGLFDFESDSKIENQLCQNILDELKNRVNDIVRHPKCFPLTLHSLTMKGYHDEELINVALSRQFLNLAYGNSTNYGKEILGLDSYVKINLKETYKGNELTEKNRRYLGKMLTAYVPDRSKKFKITANDKILLEMKETAQELFHHCYCAHVLPHFDRSDVIVAYDKSTNTGIDVAHNFPELYTGKIIDRSMLIDGLTIDTSNVEIIHIVAGGWNNYIRDTLKINGQTKMKLEQSKILGLRPVLIPWYDWTKLLEAERKHYLKQKIVNALQQK